MAATRKHTELARLGLELYTVFIWDDGAITGSRTFNTKSAALEFKKDIDSGIEIEAREQGWYCSECELEKCRCCDRCPACDGCDTNDSLQEVRNELHDQA